MNGRQDMWSMAAATPTDNAAGGRNSISYDRATPLNSLGNDFGSLQAQQFAHAQQQSAAAAYMQQQQQQQLRQQQEHSQQPRPDISDFPSLGSPPGLANIAAVGVQQPQASQLYRTIAGARPDRPQAQVQGQRPILTPDDFPALSRSTEPPNSDNASGAGLMSTAGLAPGAGVVDQASSRAPGSELNSSLANGLETTSAYKPPNASLTKAAGTASAQRPVAAADRYGMLGILTTNDYGFDVSKFGLSLPSSGALYPTFGSPWTDQTQSYGLIEPDFKLPACYNASRPPPAITKIPSLMDETLFYIFYTMPRSELQLAAAEELYRRQWRYHKELRLWLTKDPETQPSARTPRGEQGVFIFFDPGVWQRVKKEFLVLYELLEDQGALSAHVDAAGAGVRGGAQSVPPALQQLQAQPGAADSNPPSTQAQLSSMQRQGNVAMSQQQLMMLRQRQQESLQSAGRGMPGQMGFSSAQIGDVSSASDAYSQGIAAAHGLPPHLQMESPATSSNIAEDVAAASMI